MKKKEHGKQTCRLSFSSAFYVKCDGCSRNNGRCGVAVPGRRRH